MLEMRHYCQRTPDGLIHVTNMVLSCAGQHHVHNDQGFREWSCDVPPRALDWETLKRCKPCDCGLTDGQEKSGM